MTIGNRLKIRCLKFKIKWLKDNIRECEEEKRITSLKWKYSNRSHLIESYNKYMDSKINDIEENIKKLEYKIERLYLK